MAGRFLFPFETGTPSLLRRGTSPGSIGRDPRFNPLLLGSNKPGLERGTRPSAPGAPGVGDPPDPDWDDGSAVVNRGKPRCGVTRRGDPPRQFRGRMHRHPPGTDALLFRMLQVPRGPDHRRPSDHVPPSLPPVDPWRILPFLLAHVQLRCHPHGLSCPPPQPFLFGARTRGAWEHPRNDARGPPSRPFPPTRSTNGPSPMEDRLSTVHARSTKAVRPT